MRVPFLDIAAQNASIESELKSALEPVIRDGQFILGPAVEAFEQEFARYIGVDHCVGLNNGTSALHMALIAGNVGPGDEVITTPHSWISTSWAISYVGATPVFVDIDPKTYTLNPELVVQAINERTKAILPVHLYGQAADITRLRQLADHHGLLLIEDAAQAHGAAVNGRRVASIGHIGCFSFYPGKNLGAFGEGGAIVTNDAGVAERIRRLRDHAQDGRHHHVEIGFNTRMEGVQAAVLSAKLKHLDRWNAHRRRHAEHYRELLSNVPDVAVPETRNPESHVWHLFVILVQGINRDELRTRLTKHGVATGVHYPCPIPFQPAYAHLGYRRGGLPVTEDVMARCVSLPLFPEMTDEQVEFTVQALREAVPA